jgi:Activator of Hsp90 ATPase homolog 1-like protein
MTAEQMGMPAGAHMETAIVVELVDLGDRTKMTMTHIGIPADSPGGQGWAMAIDKLEQRVAEYSVHDRSNHCQGPQDA